MSRYSTIANFFGRSCLLDFLYKKEPKIKHLIMYDNLEQKTYEGVFDFYYNELKKNYRCEYIYLNEIFNNLMIRHNEPKVFLTELNINKSKADLMIINNDTTAVYEIKTELDTLSRLANQLADYLLVFDKVYVVTYNKLEKKVRELLKCSGFENVGLLILKKDGSFRERISAKSNILNIDKDIVFDILLKKERDKYTLKRDGFCMLTNSEAHEILKKCLFERGRSLDFVRELPSSLKMIGYKLENKLTKAQKEKLINKLKLNSG